MSAAYVVFASIECEVCHQFEAYSLVELYHSGRQGRPVVCASCQSKAQSEATGSALLGGQAVKREAPTFALVRKLESS